MLRGEDEVEAARHRGEVSAGLLRDVGRVIVEDDANGGGVRVGAIDELQELNELTAAVTVNSQAMDLARKQVSRCRDVRTRNRA